MVPSVDKKMNDENAHPLYLRMDDDGTFSFKDETQDPRQIKSITFTNNNQVQEFLNDIEGYELCGIFAVSEMIAACIEEQSWN